MINRYLLTSLIAIFISSKSLALDVYGKANVTINDTEDNIELNSNASRIGFKGSADLGGGLQAIYNFEFITLLLTCSIISNPCNFSKILLGNLTELIWAGITAIIFIEEILHNQH